MPSKNQSTNNKKLNIGKNASVDHRLTYVALVISNALEYGINWDERTITISEDIDQPIFHVLDAAMTIMESDSREAITIRLNSPGGSIYEAQAIVARIRNSKAYVITEGYGHIMSAATLILACGRKRRIDKFADFMWHESSYDPGFDRHSAHKETVKQMESAEKKWAQMMAAHSKKEAKFWKEKGVGKDAYFTAEQLLRYGVVDELF